MVTTTTNRLSLSWILTIIMVQHQVANMAPTNDQLMEGWLKRCYLNGFEQVNSSSVNCQTIERGPEILKVKELAGHCENYFLLGCQLGLQNFFCEKGSGPVLSNTNFDCSELDIAEDTANKAFDCCTTCKTGYSIGSIGSCDSYYVLNDRTLHRCCLAALNGGLNTITSTSFPENVTFNEFSEILRSGEETINASLANLDAKRLDSVKNFNNKSVTPSLDITTSTIELISSTFQPSSSSSESIGTEDTSVTESLSPSPSPPITTSTMNPKELSTESLELSTAAALRAVCDEGYRLSNSSDKCEDINECDEEGQAKCGNTEKCFNLKGSYKCCRLGTEIVDGETECTYIDYCEKNPCFQSEEDQHYCVNYFTGRLCVDIIPDGYREHSYSKYLLERIDPNDLEMPKILLIRHFNNVHSKNQDQHRLIIATVPYNLACSKWDYHVESYGPFKEDHLTLDKLLINGNSTYTTIATKGKVVPQAVEIITTCLHGDKPFYMVETYITFIP